MRSPGRLALIATLCCACTPSPFVMLEFPDAASEAEAAEMTVYSLEPGTDCAPLMSTGKLETWVNSVTTRLPLSEPAHLGRVSRGPAVFFAEVRDARMRPYLRGCQSATSGEEIVLKLQRVLKHVTVREGNALEVDVAQTSTSSVPVELTVRDLPLFATFDAATSRLRFTPGFADQGVYLVQLDPTSATPGAFSQQLEVVIEDVPRPLKWERLYRGWHGRFDAAALWDPGARQLIVTGGRDTGVELGQKMLYTASTAPDVLTEYRSLAMDVSPARWNMNNVVRASTAAKFGHVMGYVKTETTGMRMGFVLGGSDGAQLSPESQLLQLMGRVTVATPPIGGLLGDLQSSFFTGMASATEPDETKTYLFGGDQNLGQYSNDVRTVVMSGDTALQIDKLPVPQTGRPSARTQAAMVLAMNPRRLIIIGGRNRDALGNEQLLGDTWVLCLESLPPKCPGPALTWSRLTNTGDEFPGHTSVGVFSLAAGYDPPNDRIVTYGGLGIVDDKAWLYEDVFEIDLSMANQPDGGMATAFKKLPPPGGPYGLVGAAQAYDADGGRLLLYGGVTGRLVAGVPQADIIEDVWMLGLSRGAEQLTKLPAIGIPPYPSRRVAPSLTWRGGTMMFGGEGEGSQPVDEARVLPDGGVLLVTTPGISPLPRANMSVIYNPDLGEHWAYGGRVGTLLPNAGLYRLTPDAGWVQHEEPLEDPRFGQGLIWDEQNHRMVMFGGRGVSGLGMGASLNDVKALALSDGTLVTTRIAPTGTPPAPRYGQLAGYDKARQRMLIFGGTANVGGSEVDTRDVWQLNLTAGEERWSLIETKGTPPDALYLPAGAFTKENPPVLYVVGTVVRPPAAKPYVIDKMWKLTLTPGSEEWFPVTLPDFRPRPRVFPGSVYDDVYHRLLLAGGALDPVFRNDVWALQLP